jgi:hypothetical protein
MSGHTEPSWWDSMPPLSDLAAHAESMARGVIAYVSSTLDQRPRNGAGQGLLDRAHVRASGRLQPRLATTRLSQQLFLGRQCMRKCRSRLNVWVPRGGGASTH